MTTSVTSSTQGGDPTINPEFDKKLEINDKDSEDVKAAKLKYRASADAQQIQYFINSVQVFQGGAKSVGGQQ